MKRFSKSVEFVKRHRKAFMVMILAAVIGIGAFGFVRVRAKQAAVARTPIITTEEIKRMDLSNSISITGTIAANESQTVYSNNSGCEIVSMNVAVGDYVTEGDVICTLDSSDYEEEIAEIEKNMSIASQKSALNVEQAQRSLTQAQTDAVTDAQRAQEKVDQTVEDYNTVVDKKSDAYNTYQLAIQDREDKQEKLSALQSKLKKAKTALSEAQETLKQAEVALAEGTGDQAAVDAANQAVQEAQSEADSYQSKVTEAKSAVDAAEKTEESAKTNYESYGDKLESAVRSYESAIESQQDTATQSERTITGKEDSLTSASLDASTTNDENEKKKEEYQKLIDKCTVTAPISGVITSINIEVGDEIAQDNNEICVIQDNSSYKVEATVDQYDISSLYEGMTAVIKTDATGDVEMQGTVTFVSPTPEESGSSAGNTGNSGSSTGTTAYPVEISIKNADEKLRIGMTAETSVLTETVSDALAVPYDCIEEKENGESVIYVMDSMEPKGSVSDDATGKEAKDAAGRTERNRKEIVVQTGLETDYYTEIISDEITEGMKVIVPNSITESGKESGKSDQTGIDFGGGMGDERGGFGNGAPKGGPGGGMGGGPGM